MMIDQQALKDVYGDNADQAQRIQRLMQRHQETFSGKEPSHIVSAPGRSELIGNHTDHNLGMVLAAAVNLDSLAVVSPRQDAKIQLHSQGYAPITLELDVLSPLPQEAESSQALIRGVAAGMKARAYAVGGFDAVMDSEVFSGSGLSSSAAFEVLICAIFDALYNGFSMDALTRAQIGQYAENNFFMKPSGLMDQLASSQGGLVAIDFGTEVPSLETLSFCFREGGYAMLIVNTGGSHDDLTEAYAAVPREMKQVAQICGQEVLRLVPYDAFLAKLPQIRQEAGDRAIQRALHFYQENQRVIYAVQALKQNDLPGFFRQINASGMSSWTLLQNLYVSQREQPMALALARAHSVLQARGACRVHGGGFAGTTLNFVPQDLQPSFTKAMEDFFGKGCVLALDVRNQGAALLSKP